MAKIRVRMFATFREAAGIPEVEMEASSVQELLRALGEKFGSEMASLLSQGAETEERFVVLVNGRNRLLASERGAQLRDGDDIAIFPPVSGG